MRAFIVVGPESSGNRFFVKQLCAAGCAGHSGHDQPFDDSWQIKFSKGYPENIAFHRSFPHGGDWPKLPIIIGQLRKVGYKVIVFVMIRDVEITAASQVRNNNVTSLKEAHENIRNAYLAIFKAIVDTKVSFMCISFPSLGRKRFTGWLTKLFNLKNNPIHEIFDQEVDHKYETETLLWSQLKNKPPVDEPPVDEPPAVQNALELGDDQPTSARLDEPPVDEPPAVVELDKTVQQNEKISWLKKLKKFLIKS